MLYLLDTTAFSDLMRELPQLDDRLARLSPDENDLWIAATAMAIGATLVSRDADFARIDGLAYADWSAP